LEFFNINIVVLVLLGSLSNGGLHIVIGIVKEGVVVGNLGSQLVDQWD
jgi:hypothetical protein